MNTTEYCDIKLFYVVYIFLIQRSQAFSRSRIAGLKGPKPQTYCMEMKTVKQQHVFYEVIM
jgi:hypothetical protein